MHNHIYFQLNLLFKLLLQHLLITILISHDQHKNTRIYSDTNYQKFNDILRDTDFDTVLGLTCPDMAYDKFIELYKDAHNIAFPIKRTKTPKKFIKRSAWMTKGLVQSSLTKNKLLKKKLKMPSESNINKYKQYCKMYNRILRIAKRTYYSDQLDYAKHDMKQTWSILRSATNMNSCISPVPDYFHINGVKNSQKANISEQFNKYFVNIGKEVSNNVPQSLSSYSDYIGQIQEHSFFFDPIEPYDVSVITSKLKSKNSKGHDDISTKLVKKSINHISEPLSHIINQSISLGIVPKNMKIAKVVPIFKSGDKHIFNNYRPISILPAFSKILEKIVANKLMKFLETYKLLYKHQYGFRPKHSTIHPIIHLLDQIATNNDKNTKDFTLTVFLDLSKAFDTISHDILIKKMENIGIRGIANKWFKSYLSNRTQYMDIFNIKSPNENISCGVPQGSILGPILFLIYVNDVCKASTLNILSFADDTTISYSSSDVSKLYNDTNKALEELNQWFCANKLCLNITKTKYIVFRPSTRYPDITNRQIYIDGKSVSRIGNNENEKSFKFLGIHLDETLSFKQHISKVCTKISRSNYIINKVKNILPRYSLLTLYSSIVQSHLNYGLHIWGSSVSIGKLIRLQKKSIRIITNSPYKSHTEPLFKRTGILKLTDQYKLNVLTFMYQHKNSKLPDSFNKLPYFISSCRRLTRQRALANCSRSRTKFTDLLPLHMFPKMWNEIHPKFHEIASFGLFKRSVRAGFIEEYMDYVSCGNPTCHQCH